MVRALYPHSEKLKSLHLQYFHRYQLKQRCMWKGVLYNFVFTEFKTVSCNVTAFHRKKVNCKTNHLAVFVLFKHGTVGSENVQQQPIKLLSTASISSFSVSFEAGVESMLGQRQRHWANIEITLGKRWSMNMMNGWIID